MGDHGTIPSHRWSNEGILLGFQTVRISRKLEVQDQAPGRPLIDRELEALIVRMAKENRSWGYDRVVGTLANLGLTVSDQTVGNVLKRHGLAPAPERKTTTTWRVYPHAYGRPRGDGLLHR